MTLTIHHLQVSQSERIPWLCEELGLNYDLKLYKRAPIFAGEDYKALHPSGSAPVIQEGELTLAESGACMEYISHKLANGHLFLHPSDPAYADFLYWWHWGNGTFTPAVSAFGGAKAARAAGNTAMADYRERKLKKNLQMLDERVAGNEWLAGTDFTAADVMLVFSLTTFRYFYPYSLEGYDGVVGYLDRIGKREAYRRAMEKSDPGMELVLGAKSPEKPLI